MAESARLRALAFLQRRPGATDGDYAAEAGISQPGAHQMFRRLQREGLVRRTLVGHRFENALTRAGQCALERPPPRTRDLVEAALRHEPNVSRRSLAERLGVSATSVQYHIARIRRRPQ